MTRPSAYPSKTRRAQTDPPPSPARVAADLDFYRPTPERDLFEPDHQNRAGDQGTEVEQQGLALDDLLAEPNQRDDDENYQLRSPR